MINLDQKEFTYLEYQDFIEKHNLESFSKSQVDAFSRDVLEKSKKQEIDEYEISCAAADYASLHPVTVIREDLTKCIMYWREAQTEGVDIPDGIFKSIDDRTCRKFKETDLNIFKGIAGINCADKDAIEKAKALPIGTERMWKGKQYVKTANGWIPKSKLKDSSTKESIGEEKKLDLYNDDSKKKSEVDKLKEEIDFLKKEKKAAFRKERELYIDFQNAESQSSDQDTKRKQWNEAGEHYRAIEKKLNSVKKKYNKVAESDSFKAQQNEKAQHKKEKEYADKIIKEFDLHPKFIDRQTNSYRINVGGQDKEDFEEFKEEVESRYPNLKVRQTGGSGMTVIDVPFSSEKIESKEEKADRRKRLKEESKKIQSEYESILDNKLGEYIDSLNSDANTKMFYSAYVGTYEDKTPYISLRFKDYIDYEGSRKKKILDEKLIDDNIDKLVKKLESFGFDNIDVDEYSQSIMARKDKYDEIFEQK